MGEPLVGPRDRENEVKPVEFSFATRAELGADYDYFCAVSGLEPTAGGWGFLHCVRDDGTRMTAVTDDVDYLQMLKSTSGPLLAGMEIPEGKFPRAREGWPDEWAGRRSANQPGRNAPCPCGSGSKYKHCHGRHTQ
jgi:hypothetical protein